MTGMGRMIPVGVGVTQTGSGAPGVTPSPFVSAAGAGVDIEILPARGTATFTSAVSLSGQQERSSVQLAMSYRLLRVTTSKACRVRLYTTVANQAADAPRAVTEDPTEGSGVMLDFVTQQSPIVFLGGDLAPQVSGSSMEASPTDDIPITVDLLENGPVTVTLVYIPTE